MMKEDPAVLATLLSDVLREKDAYIGGSSMGKGLVKAARYILRSQQQEQAEQQYAMVGASDLNSDILENPECPIEESFYIVDLGVIISQFYQWRLKFPRVEPFYAVKCNPDPAIIRTVAILGGNFDCASRNEIRYVEKRIPYFFVFHSYDKENYNTASPNNIWFLFFRSSVPLVFYYFLCFLLKDLYRM